VIIERIISGGCGTLNGLDAFAAAKLRQLEQNALRRDLAECERSGQGGLTRGGKQLISFSCNDYLGLSTHPAVIEAAVAATELYGVGAGASRLVTGNHPLYPILEARLARMKGTAACAVFGSGYLANIGVIPAIVGAGDEIFADELSHSCIWAGAQLSAAKLSVFRHNDVEDLAQRLAASAARHRLVITETVFSMDGDCAPINAIRHICDQYGAWLMTDDAHGMGVVPAQKADLQMGTLSKAVGGYGGYVCASADVIALVRNRARSFVYTTGLPPGTVAAAIAALDFIAANPQYTEKAMENARFFTNALDLPEAQSTIVPVIIGAADAALRASARLAEDGFLVTAIRPPTVPAGTARLRFTFSATHDKASIARLAQSVRAALWAPA
jgi:8-amino-7-oxononanoate synthase